MKKVLFLIIAMSALVLVFAGCCDIANITTPSSTVEEGPLLAKGDVECPAAPDVAGQILEGFDIDFRYVAGTVEHPRHGEREVYENYIAQVAKAMTNEAAFPAYNWYGEWDGETYIDKCDEDAYYQAVYNYLVGLGADIPTGLSVEYVADIADGFVCQDIKDLEGNNPTAIVKDVHGNPVVGLEMRASIIKKKDFSWSEFTDLDGKVSFEGLSYDEPGIYQLRIWIRDSEIRHWAGDSALSREFQLIHNMIGSWQRGDVDRLYVIDTQENGAFSGISYSDGTAVGNVSGTVDGNSIDMLYDREGYVSGGYYVDFTGTMTSCNTASGTYVHGDDDGEREGTFDWNMERE